MWTQELYISHNEVSDVSIVAMLSSLQVLDLERYVHVHHD